MKDKKVLLARAQFLVDDLGVNTGVTIEQLKNIVAKFVEEEILLEPTALPASISGFSIRSRQGPYVIFYDKYRYGEARNLVLTHELAHLLHGDALNLQPCDFKEAIQVIMAGEEAPNILCRSIFTQNPEAEKQIELIATLLHHHIVADEEFHTNEITLAGLKDF